MILDDVCEFIVDCEHKTAPTQELGYPSIRTPNIGNGNLILEGVNRVSKETFQEWTRRGIPRANDLIIAREAPVGNVAIIPPGIEVCLGQRTVLVRPNPKLVNPRYLCYMLLGNEVQGVIQTKTAGATVPHLNMRDIRGLKITLAKREVQNEIASILSAYDELIENNSQRIKLLEQMAEEIYKEWFVRLRFPGYKETKIVDGVPEGWKEGYFADFFHIMSGGTPKTKVVEYWSGNIPFFSPKDVGPSFYTFKTESYITEEGLKNCNSRLYPRNTTIITARGTVGKVVLAGYDMAMNQSCFALACKMQGLELFTFLSTKSLSEYLKQIANGATFSAITVRSFEQSKTVMPSKEVLENFEILIQPIFDQIRILNQKNELLQKTRDLLLPRLISGKLSVEHLLDKDPEEELLMAAEPEPEYHSSTAP